MSKKCEIAVMKEMKKDGKAVKDHLLTVDQAVWQDIQKKKDGGEADFTVTIEGKDYTVPLSTIILDKVVEKTHVVSFTPGVIEPSFGIDRIFTAMLEHGYYCRPADKADEGTRGVLALAASMAPYKCTMLPLDQRIARHDVYLDIGTTFRKELSSLGLSYTLDESGATIGKRYTRNDELGVPFAITFDFVTLEDKTVTLRERDSMSQIRLPLTEVATLLRKLCFDEDLAWADCAKKYPKPSP